MFWIILAIIWFIFWVVYPVIMAIIMRDKDFYAIIPISLFSFVLLLLIYSQYVTTNDLDTVYNEIVYKECLIKELSIEANYTIQEIVNESNVALIEIENYKNLISNYNNLVSKIGNNNKYKNNIFYIHISKGEQYDKYEYYEFNWEKLR